MFIRQKCTLGRTEIGFHHRRFLCCVDCMAPRSDGRMFHRSFHLSEVTGGPDGSVAQSLIKQDGLISLMRQSGRLFSRFLMIHDGFVVKIMPCNGSVVEERDEHS